MPKLKLDRRTLAGLLQNNQQAIAAFERMFGDVDGVLPSTIEEANALAGQALAVAQGAVLALSLLTEALERLETAPAALPHEDTDDTAPRVHLGTIASQNADEVEITGGAVDGTPIGKSSRSTGAFTTLTSAGAFGCNDAPPQTSVALGAAATDLPTALTLINKIRAALIANGIGS